MSAAEQHDTVELPAAAESVAPAPTLEAVPADEPAAADEPELEQPHAPELASEAPAPGVDAAESDALARSPEALGAGDHDEASVSPDAAPQSNGEATLSEDRHATVPDISISRPSTTLPRDEADAQAAAHSDAPQEQPQHGADANGAEAEAGEAQQLPPLPSKQDAAVHAPQQSVSNGSEAAAVAPESVAPSRRSSVASTTSTTVHSRSSLSSLNKGSAVFVITALETIAASKEAKGSKPAPKALREAAQAALEMVRAASSAPSPGAPGAELDPRVVFEPLRLACGTRSTTLLITSLDCLAKLVSYSFFAEDAPGGDGVEALADVVTSTVCDTFHDALDERAQLQIVKALLSIVLSTSVHVHQSSLLKAVRTTYNIFLLSKSAPTQAVAQGALTQMVHHVFGRVPRAPAHPSQSARDARAGEGLLGPPKSRLPKAPLSGPGEDAAAASSAAQGEGSSTAAAPASEAADEEVNLDEPAEEQPAEERITLQTLETRASFEGASERDTGASLMNQAHMSEGELFVKDAFLVFRALCKLSMKPLGSDSERDLRSHAMRSKLLSLHLILTILKSHLTIFTDPSVVIHSASTGEQTAFVQAVKQYLCLSLSRNAVSSVNQVFELSCEIFWLVLSGMRTRLKKEIEVLLNEIFLPILEMRNSTAKQKSILLGVLIRLCKDPQALVEIYLNYDCDRTALDNIYERLINVISRISQTHLAPGQSLNADTSAASTASQKSSASGPSIPPTLSAAMPASSEAEGIAGGQPVEIRLKRQSLDCLCSVLRSLVIWSGRATSMQQQQQSSHDATNPSSPRASEDVRGAADEASVESGMNTPSAMSQSHDYSASRSGFATPDLPLDDPNRFENAKARKTTLIEGIKKFNFKPKRGIDFLVEHGFIRSREPPEIARFLLYADGLNKAQIGEFLGEGDASNIAIMHAFVDMMNFENMPFTDALRRYLQAFRLPGEAQKIDRFMLKFAERYVAGNPGVFANADTAYVFSYSTIMLNTDAHNPQVKHRMTLQDFIKNNSGIDDGKSLPDEYIAKVFEEIQTNEIKMKDEVAAPPTTVAAAGGGFANAIAAVGRDLQREAYVLQSEGMANKTEALFRTMVRAQRRVHPQQRAAAEQFFSASHFEHVRPMFEVAWMAFLAGISGPMQESDDMDTVAVCLDGFRDAIKIVCLFGMELERNAFVTTLAKFTFLNNLGEMKPKNIEAIKTLLGVAHTEGNYLRGSWRELLTCVSQLERFQLISGGMDERQLPELGRRGAAPAPSKATPARHALPTDEVVQAGGSSEVTVAADMVFSSTPQLSGTAIVDFVLSLSEVSWEEIQSSGMTESPRLFSLQKLVEISYYNMSRIRMEWSNIWAILGAHFNQVCVHQNPRVSAFGLDSLRQLSNRFLEKEELSHFKFQKDFLKPFEYTMRNNPNAEAKEMVLQCLQQMIASRIHNMRSGWRTLFGTFGASSKSSERVATYGFELVRQLNAEHFGEIISAGAFADLTVSLTDFAKATHAQKLALQSVSLLRGVVPAMLQAAECPLDVEADPGPAAATPMSDDPMVRFWFPSLFSFYDIIMNGDDLEVRRVALDALFEILKRYGSTFRPDFWDTVCREVLFPIFAVLRSRSDVTRFSTQEDMSVWLSTTMIQALRNLIDLWTFYFETLERLLPGLLDLLCACICQENDTLARIGTSCLQQLLEKNVHKLSGERWTQVVDTFVQLFRTTTAHQLFDPALRAEQVMTSPSSARSDLPTPNGLVPAPLSPGVPGMPPTPSAAQMTQSTRRRAFKQIIVKCVLQLLLIETTNELLQKGPVYDLIPPAELLRLTHVLDDSYRFSKRFNADKNLRMALWKVGFMKQLPNLLKQESSAAATLVHVLVRMHGDARPSHRALRASVRDKLVPLAEDVVNSYLPLDVETQARNITAWTPVVAEVFSGLCLFEDAPDEQADREGGVFARYASTFYPLAVDLLGREALAPELLGSLHRYFRKCGLATLQFPLFTEASEQARRQRVLEARERERVNPREAIVTQQQSPLPSPSFGQAMGAPLGGGAGDAVEPVLLAPAEAPAPPAAAAAEAPPAAQIASELVGLSEPAAAASDRPVTPSHAPTPPAISGGGEGKQLVAPVADAATPWSGPAPTA